MFVCVGDKWERPVPLLTAAPELRCYLQLFSLLLQLLLPFWPQGLQHQPALWEPGTRTHTLRCITHTYSFVQTGSRRTYTCIHSCRHKTHILMRVLCIHVRMHQAWSKKQVQLRLDVLGPKYEIKLSFTDTDRVIIHQNNRINLSCVFTLLYRLHIITSLNLDSDPFPDFIKLHYNQRQPYSHTPKHLTGIWPQTDTFPHHTPGYFISPCAYCWLVADPGQNNAYLWLSPALYNCLLKWGPFPVGPWGESAPRSSITQSLSHYRK